MNKRLKALRSYAAGVLGIEIKADEELNFSSEQSQDLDAAAKKEGFSDLFVEEHNATVKSESANQHIIDFMQSKASDDEGKKGKTPIENTASLGENVQTLTANMTTLTADNKKLKGQVDKLAAGKEDDTPTETITGTETKVIPMVIHSKSHLFASDETFNAFKDRPWNNRAGAAKSPADIGAATTDWNTINIDKINTDFGAYARKNMDKIISLMRDGFDIPSHWSIISGVSDQIAFAALLTGKITQGKKKKWLPKNKHKFVPQIGKIYDVQIDATWTGWELKLIEKSWLNSFFNNVNSSPYKMSFVEYLVVELLKQARKEDKIGLIKGVYFPNNDMDLPGSFLNAQSGLLKLIATKKGKEYNAFDLGEPTIANIYDYINNMVSKLPHDIRILPDLQLGMSIYWMKAYQNKREELKGLQPRYEGKQNHVDGYPNIKFVPLTQFEGSNFMFITTWDNIAILADKPGEENMITFEKSKRDIDAFADYKIGPYVYIFGAQMADGNVQGFHNQLFFSNDVEVLQDVYVPVPANVATPTLKYHHSLIIGEHNTAPTNITNFTKANAGQKIYLMGNNDTNKSTVKNNANILIGSDCVLTSTTLLILVARSDGKFIELYRTDTAIATTAVKLAADATTADAASGTEFVTQANTGATAFTDIDNAVADERYKITGGSSASATTIANTGVFTLSKAMTLGDGKWIELYYNGDKFIETARG